MIDYIPELHKELILKEIKRWNEIEEPEIPSYMPKNEPPVSVFVEIEGETYRIPHLTAIQLVIEANKEVIDEYQNSFIDQQFGMDTFVPKRVYYNKDYKLSDITSETPMEKRSMKIDYTK